MSSAATTDPAPGLHEPMPFACIDCGGRAETQRACPSCGGGPLMDFRNPDVRATLVEEDAQRRSKRRYLMIWFAVPMAIVMFLLTGGGLLGAFLGGLIGYGTSLGLAKVFPAKQLFTDLARAPK